MKVLRVGFFFCALLFHTFARGDILNDLEMQTLRSARSADELSAKQRKLGVLRVAERACRIELRENRLPYDCYEIGRHAVGEWSSLHVLIPSPKDLATACLRAARATEETTIKEVIGDPKCLQVAREKAELNVYKQAP